MELKTQLLLVSGSIVVSLVGVSEVLSYQRAAEFFTQHELRLQQSGQSEAVLAALGQEKPRLLLELAALRLMSAAGALLTLAIAINLLFSRAVSRPINLLLNRISSMMRGTWTQPVAVERQDEIGRLVKEFNLLGPKLTFRAHQYAAASKLAAMALIGQRVTRRTGIARNRLLEIQDLLAEARFRNQCLPPAAMNQLAEVAEDLADLTVDLESEFDNELIRQGLPGTRSIPYAKKRPQRVGSGGDALVAS